MKGHLIFQALIVMMIGIGGVLMALDTVSKIETWQYVALGVFATMIGFYIGILIYLGFRE